MKLIPPGLMYWCLPPVLAISDAAIAYALDLANGDFEDEREIIDVEFEEISSTNERPLALPDNQ
ncbi:hypothetical protein [Duncaniella muris]|jgi:hypothetical protein|uniref:hypothetical protein n=1 Tax=Duncaniella muris TaxID=2094150 RepID=UPI00267614D9|nr:hypothetical protein [Duncaniella muris]